VAGQVFPAAGVPISGRVTPASFPFYTTGEDNLRIVSYNSAAGVRLKVIARLLGTDAKPTPDSWDHTPLATRAAAQDDYALSGSTLLNVQVVAVAGAPLIGQTFVILQLIRGLGAAAIVVGTILQGYVTTVQALGWPGSPIQNSLDGTAALRYITGTQPAAGSTFLETVPTGARWRLLSFHAFLTTSAGAGNRQPILEIRSAAGRYIDSPQIHVAVAAQSVGYFWTPGMPLATDIAALGPGVAGLPAPCELTTGCTIQDIGTGFLAGDQWSAPIYTVQEYLDI
jgi:hypothetical protein